MTNNQNPCREIDGNDLEILTGLRPRMSEEYKRIEFFPAMFRAVQIYKEKGFSMQFAFNELSKLTGYKLQYLKNTYYELLHIEADAANSIDENVNPLNSDI